MSRLTITTFRLYVNLWAGCVSCAIRSSRRHPLRPSTAEGMHRPRARGHPPGDPCPLADDVLLSRLDADFFAVERQRVGAFDDEEPLVELVDVFGGDVIAFDGPEGHLAAVRA